MAADRLDLPNSGDAKLLEALAQLQAARIASVMYSVTWDWLAPAEDGELRWEYLDALVGATCGKTQLKVFLLLDIMRPPPWIFTRYPDCTARDSGNREYRHLSWYHPQALEKAMETLEAVAKRLASRYSGCVRGMQPVLNNEYEAKFTQEYDSFQDYNVFALAAYRRWLRQQQPELDTLNVRWDTKFSSWAAVKPPRLQAGTVLGVEGDPRFWDWMQFRVESGAEVLNRACGVVKSAGLMCFHHTPEFFSVLDSMYGASLFKYLSASPNTDFIIMDSNFRTPYGTVMDPQKLRIYVGAAKPYGKPVYFEAAVERYNNMSLLVDGYKASLLAGAPNLGITNWLGRVDLGPGFVDALHGAGERASACAATERVGVFIHLDSCNAWLGLQYAWAHRDPLHNFVEALAHRLTAGSSGCGTDLEVHIELHRFHRALPTFDRAVFVEPLVLYGGEELRSYVAVKGRLDTIPHEVLRLPTNSSRGLRLLVIDDLRPSAR
ncbi:hypothetical protein HYH03_014031 [Edaphochlamys debaryana]|uniref:Glycoside hydrolase family 42 N-terminal domain-containing protein n=1 Tax=Edaphochlamys debaryana TaxID=47281 RepID=A0A836BTX9_9CHLO|nr:hypothetical protein HYH03_014031 [Edaphochlamys debaryana]|eukprot:KAG2487314.1 hypothetical protein HYH03_014031 [Edaphochlamys debaryana]